MNQEDNFVIVLPSNTPSSIPNTPSNYLTTFHEPFYLDNGQWEVALLEMNFKNSIKTIHADEVRVLHRKWIELNPGSFSTANVLTRIEAEFSKNMWYYLKENKKDNQFIFGDKNANGKFNYEVTTTIFNDMKAKTVIKNKTKHKMTLRMPFYLSQILGFNANAIIKETDYSVVEFILEPNSSKIGDYFIPWITSGKDDFLPLAPADKKLDEKIIAVKYNPLVEENWECIVKPKPGRYAFADDLVKELNKNLKHFSFAFDPRVNRFEVKSTVNSNEYILMLLNGIHDVLGFTEQAFQGTISTVQAPMEVNLLRGISSLFVYCDVCEPIRVGNTMVPLLRNVCFNTTKYGEMVHVSYNNPIYVRAQKSFVDKINISICDAAGATVPFEEGLTTVVLHFRRL